MVPWWISHWRVEAALLGLPALRFLGGVLLALGAVGILDSFSRFAIQGIGTPAPVFPTRHLVVTGLYRYVRNPIYVAVVSTILGQGLIFGNVSLFEYGGLVWLFFSPRSADLRRTNPNGEFWFRLRGLLCRGPALDSPPHPLDCSSGRVTPTVEEASPALKKLLPLGRQGATDRDGARFLASTPSARI